MANIADLLSRRFLINGTTLSYPAARVRYPEDIPALESLQVHDSHNHITRLMDLPLEHPSHDINYASTLLNDTIQGIHDTILQALPPWRPVLECFIRKHPHKTTLAIVEQDYQGGYYWETFPFKKGRGQTGHVKAIDKALTQATRALIQYYARHPLV